MAPTSTHSGKFFGMDTSQWPRQWRAAGRHLLARPLLRWLRPAVRVQLRHPDGAVSAWSVAHGLAMPVADANASTAIPAVELPFSRVLDRRLTLPPLAAAELAQAVQLEVASASPFGAEQTVFGFDAQPGPDGLTRVDLLITSRRDVEQALREAGADLAAPPEVWVLPGHLAGQSSAVRPIVLLGCGEAQRRRAERQGLAHRLGLMLLALALLAALALTPTLMLRQRAIQAQQALEALQRQAAPQLAQREALMQGLERLQAVDKLLAQQLALPPVLDMLTRALPDGAWLTALRADGVKLVLNGHADDAAALVQRLAAEPGVHDVRLASPATRGVGATKETFIIELQLDARRYGLARPAGSAS